MSSSPRRPSPRSGPALGARDIDHLQALLDRVPAPLEPLDVSMLDGYLCGVLVQPQPPAAVRWLAHVTDADGRALPRGFDAAPLHALVLRRHAELDEAIAGRRWFDPWVFEMEGETEGEAGAAAEADADDDEAPPEATDAVYPWVAGFATALEVFPALMATASPGLTEPLALLYRHLDADDLEDADELLAEIESMEPPADLADAVEGLVRATLLLADVGRPLAAAPGSRRPPRPRR